MISEPRRHTVEMYASAVIAFTYLYTYDLDPWPLTSTLTLDPWPLTLDPWPLTSTLTLDLWPYNLLRNFHPHDEYLWQVHWNRSTKYKDIASRETGVNRRTTDGRTDGRTTRKYNASAACTWRRHKIPALDSLWWSAVTRDASCELLPPSTPHTAVTEDTRLRPWQFYRCCNLGPVKRDHRCS